MVVTSTSIDAYYKIINTLSDRRLSVFQIINNFGPVTDKQISEYLNWPINRVTGRRGELAKLEIIVCCGTKIQDGFRAKLWETVSPMELSQ